METTNKHNSLINRVFNLTSPIGEGDVEIISNSLELVCSNDRAILLSLLRLYYPQETNLIERLMRFNSELMATVKADSLINRVINSISRTDKTHILQSKLCQNNYNFDLRSWLIHHWKLNDDAADTVVLDSAGTAHGTATDNTNVLSAYGKINKSLSFNGTAQRVNCGTISDFEAITGSFSICAWVYRNSLDTVNTDAVIGNWRWTSVANDRSGCTLRWYINTQRFQFILEVWDGVTNTEIQVGGNASPNQWHFVVGTWNQADFKARFYLNGILANTSTANTGKYPRLDSPWNFWIGYSEVNAGWFNGRVDNAMIFNKALSQDEVDILYNNGHGTEEPFYKDSARFASRSNKTASHISVVDRSFTSKSRIDKELIETTEFNNTEVIP